MVGLLLLACAHHLPATMTPADVLPWRSDDGWTGTVRHYPGPGEPVLLVHGMGANHDNWDFREEVSLAAWLADAGWDVWVPELRGDPGATAPSKHAQKNYTFDDHATQDIPAIVAAVREKTKRDRLFWVGHSMGGMLLYTWMAQHPETVAAGVTIGSPATLIAHDSLHRAATSFGWAVGRRGAIPVGWAARATAWMGRSNPIFPSLANKDNLDYPVANGLAREALIDMPRPMARQALTWLRSGDILRTDGRKWLAPMADNPPILAMGGSVDQIVPEANARYACEIYSHCRYILLGRDTGFSADYGHVDPVLGKTARAEIYPLIGRFLAEQRDGMAIAVAAVPASSPR